MIGILNVETNEQVIREMTDEEYAQHLKDVAAWEAEQASQNATE